MPVKSIFITGAASGMGREGARLFHGRGWRVGAVDRNNNGLDSLTGELGADRLWTRAVDVTDKAALQSALADFCAGNPGGGLDMMWNNAGIGAFGSGRQPKQDLGAQAFKNPAIRRCCRVMKLIYDHNVERRRIDRPNINLRQRLNRREHVSPIVGTMAVYI